MRRRIFDMRTPRVLSVLAAIAALLPLAGAQTPPAPSSPVAKAIAALREKSPRLKVALDDKGVPVSLLELGQNLGLPATAGNTAKAVEEKLHLEEIASLLGLTGSRQGVQTVSERPDSDFPGQTIVKVQAMLDDLPVFGSQATVVARAGGAVVSRIDSALARINQIATTHAINSQAAITAALNRYDELLGDAHLAGLGGTDQAARAPEAKLVIFEGKSWNLPEVGTRLAWLITLPHLDVLIDATDGKVLYDYRKLLPSRQRSIYDLADANQFPGTLMRADNPMLSDPSAPADVRNAYDGLGRVYDYFARFGSDSFDGAGGRIRAFVRLDHEANAYWDRDAHAMFFGPGYASEIDVVGHELTHGFVQHLVNNPYRDQSGAVDEFLADFFGCMVARATGQPDWTIGSTLPGWSAQRPLRSLSDPHKNGFNRVRPYKADTNSGQPDHMDELVKPTDKICFNPETRSDDGCVHFNSGILNKAAYLAAMGGTHPRSNITVTPIGPDKLARIVYRTMETLTQSPTLLTTGIAAVTACGELAGGQKYSITEADCANLRIAFSAVGLNWTVVP
jgi:Zn-dependent metalloprotease